MILTLKDCGAILISHYKFSKYALSFSLLVILFIFIAHKFQGMARSVFIMDGIFTIFLIGGFRVGIRLFFAYMKKEGSLRWGNIKWWNNNGGNNNGGNGGNNNGGNNNGGNNNGGFKKRNKLVIIGAGDAGEKTLREINDNQGLMNYKVVGFS